MLTVLIALTTLAAPRVITVGSSVTEIVYALGAEAHLVAVDTSSVYPQPAERLPQVGYYRQLSLEGLLSLEPTVLLATADAGPPDVLSRVAELGVRVSEVPHGYTVAALAKQIWAVARALGKERQAAALATRVQREVASGVARAQAARTRPRVLFIYARGGGTMNVAGRDTAAHAMIELAGGVNAAADLDGYRPLTAEAAVSAQPDVLLVTTRGLASVGGAEALLAAPGLGLTPAGKAARVVALDDLLLLGFGPRLGAGISTLAERLHPELTQ